MSKYASGLSYNEILHLELDMINDVLNKYEMDEKDKKLIEATIVEGYYQAHTMARGGRVLQTMLEEATGKDIDFKRFLELDTEEAKKYPFNDFFSDK